MSGAQSQAPTSAKPYVRVARKDELDELSVLSRRAFIADPLFNYAGNLAQLISNDDDCLHRRTLQKFHRLMIGVSMEIGGRVTVVAIPASSGESSADGRKEELAGFCIWLPEGKHMGPDHPITWLRLGALSVVKGWGLTGVKRLAIDYAIGCEKAWEDMRKCQGLKANPAGEWYIQLVCTAPEHQGKGYMSLILREMIEYAPNHTLTLDATTAKARDQYAHLGFSVQSPWRIGVGRADSRGLKAKGDDATGMELYAMAKQ